VALSDFAGKWSIKATAEKGDKGRQLHARRHRGQHPGGARSAPRPPAATAG
jgi:hypothetical protein